MSERDPHHQHPDHHHGDGRPEFWAFVGNVRGTGEPWFRVLGQVASNFWIKVTTRRNCCGNLGQPGC